MKHDIPPPLATLLVMPVFHFFAGPLVAQEEPITVTLRPFKDAVIYAEDNFDGNDRANGAGEQIVVGSFETGLPRRTLMSFAFDESVPPGSTITEASLQLKVSGSSAALPFLFIYRLDEAWTEGDSDPERDELGTEAQNGDVTWFYRNFQERERDAVPWEEPGGDFDPRTPILRDAGRAGLDRVVSFTSDAFTADVQSILDNPDEHFGWILLSDEDAFSPVAYLFHSLDARSEEDRPSLEVTYVPRSPFDQMVGSFDELETVAGRGRDLDRDNSWDGDFEGGAALDAELSRPLMSVQDKAGNVYIADTYAHAVRCVDTDGVITTIAGTNVPGFNGDGMGSEAQLNLPSGLRLIADSLLYVVDTDNDRIRRLNLRTMELVTVVHDEAGIETGRGLWVREDGGEIIYASRSVLKKWTRTEPASQPVVFAEGFTHLGFLDRDEATGDILAADFEADVVWRVTPDGGKTVFAGGGTRNISGFPATETRLPEVHGIVIAPYGCFVATVEGGDIWFIDDEGICRLLIRGNANANLVRGEGDLLSEIVENEELTISEPLGLSLGPDGDLVITTNPSGLVRIVRKGMPPVITAVGVNEDEQVEIGWRSEPGKTYHIEAATELNAWEFLGERTANRQTTTFVDESSPMFPVRFYRVYLFP